MSSGTERDRNRTHLASVLRLLFGPVVLLALFHAGPVFAVSHGVVSIATPSENVAVDAGLSTEAELPMCDLTDISLPIVPGSCPAPSDGVTSDGEVSDGLASDAVARAAREDGAKSPADKAPADKAPADKALADKPAPMCDSDATSIAAPVEIPEVDRGHFEPLPCDGQALLALLRARPLEGGIQLGAGRESPPRAPLQSSWLNDGKDGTGALSVPLHWGGRAAPSTLAAHWRGGLAWQPGYRSRIDRPPSLRA